MKATPHEPFTVMAKDVRLASTPMGSMTYRATVTLERCRVKTFLIISTFIAMVVAPAFCALNVFTEKNRF
jgi:hypothetical protein